MARAKAPAHARGNRKAPRAVGRNNLNLDQGRNAVVDKVYCCAIPLSKATEQHQAAVAAGKSERSIYVEGRGAETFDACVASFRTGGTLGLVGGLRVLGTSRKAIVARVLILKSKGIVPYNLETGERDETKLLDAALAAINGARGMGLDPRRPRNLGAKGGKAKGIKAQQKRNAIMAAEAVQRMCAHPKLNYEDCAAILGPGFSASTLRRLHPK